MTSTPSTLRVHLLREVLLLLLLGRTALADQEPLASASPSSSSPIAGTSDPSSSSLSSSSPLSSSSSSSSSLFSSSSSSTDSSESSEPETLFSFLSPVLSSFLSTFTSGADRSSSSSSSSSSNEFLDQLRISFYSGVLQGILLPNKTSSAPPPSTGRRLIFEESSTTPDLIKRFGYSVEVHHVVTEDGYMLELHRIPPSSGSGEVRRRPVLLQHGFWSSSSCWLLQEKPKNNLPMLLADLGYDVWLGNSRGNTYGRRHLILNSLQPNFWSFSWDQMARYDLPATIDHILKESGPEVDDLFYVGFSMGARTFVAMMNERPEYNHKVRAMVGLAPSGAIPHLQGFFRTVAPFMPLIQNLGSTIGLHELRLDKPSNRALVQVACKSQQLCLQLYTSFGPGTDVNKGFLRTQLQRYQSSTSMRTLAHYTQLIMPGRFAKYNFGAATNQKVYGQGLPPEYHPQAVQVPVYFFSGTADHSAAPKDVATLARAMPTLQDWVQIPGYNHLDFIMGVHAEEKVYEPILSILEGFD